MWGSFCVIIIYVLFSESIITHHIICNPSNRFCHRAQMSMSDTINDSAPRRLDLLSSIRDEALKMRLLLVNPSLLGVGIGLEGYGRWAEVRHLKPLGTKLFVISSAPDQLRVRPTLVVKYGTSIQYGTLVNQCMNNNDDIKVPIGNVRDVLDEFIKCNLSQLNEWVWTFFLYIPEYNYDFMEKNIYLNTFSFSWFIEFFFIFLNYNHSL